MRYLIGMMQEWKSMYKGMYKDAIGREIKVGDVCVKFYGLHSSGMVSNLCVVRKLNKTGTIQIEEPGTKIVNPQDPWKDWKTIKCLKKNTVHVSSYLVIIRDLKEEDVLREIDEK